MLTYTDALDGVAQDGVTVNKVAAGGYTIEVEDVAIKSQQDNDWSGLAVELPWWGDTAPNSETPADTGANTTGTLTFTYNSDLEITGVAFA